VNDRDAEDLTESLANATQHCGQSAPTSTTHSSRSVRRTASRLRRIPSTSIGPSNSGRPAVSTRLTGKPSSETNSLSGSRVLPRIAVTMVAS
jgi:hypothetical protein